MGRYTFRLPDIGEGIAKAEIVAWHVVVGDMVEEDAQLADMMTDKATVEMESPVAGRIIEVAGEVGDTVAIGSALVVIEVEGAGNEHADHGAAPEPSPLQGRGLGEGKSEAEKSERTAKPHLLIPSHEGGGGNRSISSGKVLASPAVRARAHDLGVDLSEVPVGDTGHVTHADLDGFLTSRMPAKEAGSETKGDDEQESAPLDVLSGAGEAVKVIGLRRRIAENMAASKRHIPHFTYVEECDVTELEDMRGELNERRGEKPKLTMLPLLIRAICAALPDFPMINARYDEAAGIVQRYESVHLGMATQTDGGLMVPVIRDAQAKSLWQLAEDIARLAAAARDGTAKPEELSGSTFTITSLGPLGGIVTTPVINRPEVAIIGPNRIVERPVFVPDGQGGERIAKRKLLNISISCDHRVVDGWDAANYVQAVKRLIESPMMLLAGC